MKCTIFLVLFVLAYAYAARASYETKLYGVRELVQTRCSTQPKDTYMFFNGSIFAYPTGERNKEIFKFVGMNVARCHQKPDGSYTLTSRELLFYLDPITKQLIHSWTNPWTGETVPVVHVANDPVQQSFPNAQAYSAMEIGDSTVFFLDIPLYYPNPLAGNPAFAPYSPQPFYQAGEFFKFIVPTKDLSKRNKDQVSSVAISWTRTSPYLPWMKLGDKGGYLFYSSQGARVDTYEELPQLVKDQIAQRVPIYRHAPHCYLNAASVSSWTYFKTYFAEYLAGAQFPIPATQELYPCL